MTELERRVAHLERELAWMRWRTRAAVGATALLVAMACRGGAKEMRVDQLHVGELEIERMVVIGDRDKAHVAIDPHSIEVAAVQQRTLIRPTETTIGDDRSKLDLLAIHDNPQIELSTEEHRLNIGASSGLVSTPPLVPTPANTIVPIIPAKPIPPPKPVLENPF